MCRLFIVRVNSTFLGYVDAVAGRSKSANGETLSYTESKSTTCAECFYQFGRAYFLDRHFPLEITIQPEAITLIIPN